MKIRSTNRLYVGQPLENNAIIALKEDDMHYICNVLRLKVNNKLRIFNDHSGEFVANIVSLGKKELHLHIEKLLQLPKKSQKLVLAPCLIKNDKMADMLSMSVQLGATEIIPIISEHTVHRNFRKDRFEKIVIEASEQSERCDIPTILDSISLQELLASSKYDHIIYANENESENGTLSADIAKLENIVLIVGPEGGFSDKEFDMLEKAGAISVSLGKNILRAETAAIKLLSYIQFLRDFKFI